MGGPLDLETSRPSSSNTHSILRSMSTKDQLLYSALHGTAMRYAAERRNLDEAIEELRQIADGRNDILAEPRDLDPDQSASAVVLETMLDMSMGICPELLVETMPSV